MSVATVVAQLQSTHGDITGITSAPTEYPASLNTADLPMVLTFPKEAEWSQQAVGLKRQTRTYEVWVLVAPLMAGKPVYEGFTASLPFFDLFGDAYLSDLTLGGNVDHIGVFSDRGLEVLTYAGTEYFGIRFQLPITEKTS